MTVHSVFDDQTSPSLFEGINARYYRATEITRNFVPNDQYDNLAVRQHSLIVGPRGSGKTTLLRMLHPECLGLWSHPDADKYRSKIEFSGIYVFTDRVWRAQVEAASAGSNPDDTSAFTETVVSLDVMSAMLRTIELRVADNPDGRIPFRPVHLDRSKTAKLVSELADGWMLSPMFLDFGSLRVAVRKQRMAARQWIQSTVRDQEGDRPAWVGMPWDESLLLGIDAFEESTGTHGEPWALLFDEAEIAPTTIRQAVLRSTRGMDPRLLLKCSLSPWLEETPIGVSPFDGTVFNDFNTIRLFYGHRSEGYDFSRKLIQARLASAGRPVPDGVLVEEAVFGRSKFTGDLEGKGGRTAPAYGDESPLGQVVKDLAAVDPNFREWLVGKSIDPERLDDVEENVRARTLRKARNIMLARLEFRKASGFMRSRKTIAMYAGGSTMLDICEGNPRLLLGLLLPLLEYYDGQHSIPEALQADALDQIATDFYALIDAIPVSPGAEVPKEFRGSPLKSPYRYLIERIARYFRDEVLRGQFNPQPKSTFRVGSNTSVALQGVIGRLINVGAIILIPDRGFKDLVTSEFDQHKMRLCYLIAAREHLPPNVDRPVSIGTIVGRRRRGGGSPDAEGLPGFEEENEDDGFPEVIEES